LRAGVLQPRRQKREQILAVANNVTNNKVLESPHKWSLVPTISQWLSLFQDL